MQEVIDFFRQHVVTYVKEIGILDIIDILLLGLLLYVCFAFLREKRSAKLLWGIGVFVVLLLVSSVLKMTALHYVLSSIYRVGVIVLAIVYQPELRAALEKIGSLHLFGSRNGSMQAQSVEQIMNDVEAICDAANEMSRSRTGALMVLEQADKLDEYIKSGVIVNAQMSSFLLRNIFFNKAPLHDGAVILRNHRIFAAGCFVPLSTRDDITQSLGTRHRAAIGLSEVCDAVVIVVSEETGNISIAMDGELKRGFKYNTLKQELLGLLMPTGQGGAEKEEK